MAVPKRGNPASFALARQGITGGGDYLARISTNQQICALRDGDRALGVLTQSETGDAKSSGFFLNTPRVGEDELCFAQETQKIEVPDGRNDPQLGVVLDAGLRQMLLGAGMHGKDYGHFRGDGIDRSQKLGEFLGGVDVGRSMEGEDTETPPARSILQTQFIANSGLLGDGQKVAQGIDHHVADHEDAFPGPAFFEEMRDGLFFGNKEIVCQGVGQDAVDFFGHGAVKAAEPGFDVGYTDTKFGGGQRDSNGGVDVAHNENQVGFALNENRFNALQDFGGLGGVGARTDFEIHVWRGDAHLTKENVGEFLVIVLAGVDKDGFDFRMTLHLVHEGGNFGEVRARPDNIQDFQALAHRALVPLSEGSIASGHGRSGRQNCHSR